ncbi:hypothetical protein NKDENANG_02462 [Candidatus Entotheonellaceae bacterium PAL068K]
MGLAVQEACRDIQTQLLGLAAHHFETLAADLEPQDRGVRCRGVEITFTGSETQT